MKTETKQEKTGQTDRHWESYWSSKDDDTEFYSNEDRIIRGFKHVGDPVGRRVLEVGAGSGRDSCDLAAAGATVHCLDNSRSSITLIRKIDRDRKLRLIVADALAAPFKPGVFDVVFHQGLLEHFREPKALLEENRRLLKPGGYLLVDVPQTFHPLTIVKKVLMLFDAWFAGWETQYRPGELESLLRGHQFQPLARIGEWMRPSLLYRCLRTALKGIGFRLPLYPLGLPGSRRLRCYLHNRLSDRHSLAVTYPSVGVISRKAETD
ncbi:class I SAM-dependent methyltransferase [candidate division KSB1 bacterium]